MSLSKPQLHQERRITITGRDHILSFGKYKGLSIEEVLEINPDYLLYCQENVESFDLDHKLIDEAEQAAASYRP